MKKIVQKIIVAGIVAHNGKILIIQRGADEDVFPNLWEIPSGKREPFEKSQDALVREVEEETGIRVKPLMPVDVFEYKVEKENEIRDSTQINFIVTSNSSEVKISEEHQNFAWITKDEINKYNMSEETKKVIRTAFDLYPNCQKP